jgi:hypothetical protein
MQSIKAVIVGDGAVGKVSATRFSYRRDKSCERACCCSARSTDYLPLYTSLFTTDLLAHLLHYQRFPCTFCFAFHGRARAGMTAERALSERWLTLACSALQGEYVPTVFDNYVRPFTSDCCSRRVILQWGNDGWEAWAGARAPPTAAAS